MRIKICGHKIRMRKPIKIFNLVKAACVALMLCALAVTPFSAPAYAADSNQKASTGAAASCDPFQDKCMTAPANADTPQHRTQRKAGSNTMSPALALAMALGFRNVQGPVEHKEKAAVRVAEPAAPTEQSLLLPEDVYAKRSSSNAAGIRFALENRSF